MINIGVAVVGAGFIGPVHVEGLRRAGVNVVGILGSSAEKSAAAARRLGLPRGYHHLAELLADPAVQAVQIASPNRVHFEQVVAAIQAGKHVLCEKPLVMNARESAELVRLAAGAPVVTGVNYNIRYYPLCREVAERVRAGQLGDIFHIAGSYAQDWLLHDTDFNWRVDAGEGGELRAVADIGTHWLDLAQHLTGRKIISVCADLQTVHPRRQRPVGGAETFSGAAQTAPATESIPVTTDDFGSILLRFAGGARGCLWVSQVTAGRKNCLRIELAGARQAVAWDSERPNELWIGHRGRPNELLPRDPALLHPAAQTITNYPGGHNEGFPDTFKQLSREFYNYISAGDFRAPRPFPTFADGHREILLCEAILRSHRERAWIDLPADPENP